MIYAILPALRVHLTGLPGRTKSQRPRNHVTAAVRQAQMTELLRVVPNNLGINDPARRKQLAAIIAGDFNNG